MELTDIDYIRKDQSVDKRVLEVYELLKQYKDSSKRAQWIERRKKNWAAIENDMTDEKIQHEMYKTEQEDIIVNKCVEGVEGSTAIITNQQPEVKFLPIGSGDLYVAELMKRGFDQVWENNETNDTAYEIVEEQRIGAHGFFNIEIDHSKDPFGAIIIEEDNPEDLYWDPKSKKRDYSDTALIKAKLRSLEYIKAEYGDKIQYDKEIYFSPTGETDEAKSSGITGGDNYKEPPDVSIDPDALKKQRVIWEIEAWLLQKRETDWKFTIDEYGEFNSEPLTLEKNQKIEDVVDFNNKDAQTNLPKLKGKDNVLYWRRKITSRIKRVIVGKKLISEDINPHGFDREGNPLMKIIGYKGQRTLSSYCMSRTDYALPINRELNKRRAQAMYLISNQYGGTLVRSQDSHWENRGTPREELVVGKTSQVAPFRIQPGTIDAQILIQLVQEAKNDINDIYHTQDVVRGKLPPGHGQIAGRTILALQDFAGMMSVPDTRKFEAALIRTAKIVMALMLRYWPRSKWERLLEDEEKFKFAPEGSEEHKQLEGLEEEDPEQERINQIIAQKWAAALELIRPEDPSKPAGLSLLNIDVKVVTGSSMPTNRIAKMEMAIELYGKGQGIYDREAALEYVDDPQKDKIIQRMKKAEEAALQQALLGKR